jgi:DNA polymerase (family 10)
MHNQELSKIFYHIAIYLAMDDIPFKPQAYERAAMALESLSEDAQTIYEREGIRGLEQIQSVGKSMAEKIEEYIKTGKIKYYEEYRKRMPVNIEELTSIEGVGPKMVRDLWHHLKIKNITDLERAAKAGKIRDIPNFGEKTEQNILQGIGFVKRSTGRFLLGDIYPFVEKLTGELKNVSYITEAVAAGSIRRMKETIGDVDILVTTPKPEKAIDYFLSLVTYSKIWGRGPTKVSVHTAQGFDIDIRVLPKEFFGAGLQYFTGSKEHNVKLRTYAVSKGFKVSEYGVFRGRKRLACKTEEEVYKVLGMPYIEPELREDGGEIEAGLAGKLPKLISYNSLKGDLQVQTNWTDGNHSIEEMAKAAKEYGLEYIAITDHTRDLAMTGGSDEKKLMAQISQIDAINKKGIGVKVLKGAEVNIRKDGSLDIKDEVLAKLDVVGASVHSLFKMSKKDMTERVVRAMENPHVDIIFHPTGRLIGKREAYEVDMGAVIKAAKRTGTVLEANAFPSRLDLRDVDIRMAVDEGVKIAIDSDAHHKNHFSVLKYGIAQARRGWATANDVINTKPLKEMLKQLKKQIL